MRINYHKNYNGTTKSKKFRFIRKEIGQHFFLLSKHKQTFQIPNIHQ